MSAFCYHILDEEDQCQTCGLVMYEASPCTALLAKLRDEVLGLQLRHECNGDDEIELQKTVSFNHALKQVLDLIANLEKAGG